MQLVMAQRLRERGHVVTASVPFPDDDRAIYERAGVRVVPSSRRRLVRATWLLLRLAAWALLGRPQGRAKRLLLPDDEADWFAKANLVVDLSGDMLTEDYGPHVTYSHFLPLATAVFSGTPYAIVAQSIGPFRLMRVPARWLLRRAALITVRDTISRDYLVSLGLKAPIVTADLAFLLNEDADAARNAISRDALPSGPFLGVSISNLIASHYVRRAGGSSKEQFLVEMARSLDKVAQEHGLSIVLFPHVTGPKADKDDRLLSNELADRLESAVVCVEEDLGPAEIKGMIGQATVFLGARMHANIAALSSGVPTIAIAYSHKTPGIMNLLGVGDYVIDIGSFSADLLDKQLDSLLRERDAIARRLNDELEAVRLAAELNVHLVAALLDPEERPI